MIRVQQQGAVCEIILDRPQQRNALTVDCDALGVSGGFNPNLGLSSHLGSRPAWSDRIAAFVDE